MRVSIVPKMPAARPDEAGENCSEGDSGALLGAERAGLIGQYSGLEQFGG